MMSTIRRKAFRMALASEEKSIAQWADENDVSYTHLQLVLSNKRPSRRMAGKVDSYVAATLVPFYRALFTELGEAPPAEAGHAA